MRVDLSGEWIFHMEKGESEKEYPKHADGKIMLPGSLQSAGYGYPVSETTEWLSGLHNPFWHEREEYSYRSDEAFPEYRVPFLSQPSMYFVGKVWYEREFTIPAGESQETGWLLFIECTKWRSEVYLDGDYIGGDCSLCTAHKISCGKLSHGVHRLKIGIDNSMQYAYRPDAHTVSDAIGASWNGMVGEISLLTMDEVQRREKQKQEYAQSHPRKVQIKNGQFIVDGKIEYFRGTHFGGDYPLTGYPAMERKWWEHVMATVKAWGLNFIRCHSYCPPDVAFLAADEAGVYLQPECGMWNIFEPEEEKMNEVLTSETVRILKQFGHHPSFVLFSPTNEPGGNWYEPLKRWVELVRSTDRNLGYEGRRFYTAQSGWFFDVPPKEIKKKDMDYLYFHRSAYGPIFGGKIRGEEGWKGQDYEPSIEGVSLPVICHEMGQWCSYPDFDEIIPKYTGFLRPGNYELFRENAKARGVLALAKDFAYCSGRNQLRLYKEDIEANLRTEHLYGFEMLDLHDYSGQGTALVGILDAFWESKGAVKEEEFRRFCSETVLLVRLESYVFRAGDILRTPVEICHFGQNPLIDARVVWRLIDRKGDNLFGEGIFSLPEITCGKNTMIGVIEQRLEGLQTAYAHCILRIELSAENLQEEVSNQWDVYVYAVPSEKEVSDVLDTHDFTPAKQALAEGKTVIFRPWMSDLDYDCPPVGILNSFWNNQMGPRWQRGVGLSVCESHPIFKEFPTAHDGGWQWEEILDYARGFGLRDYPDHQPLVRVIDEWNRNLPMGILLEADVGGGRLLLVSADLETEADKRPAAQALNRAIIHYAQSGDYAKAQSLPIEAIADRLFPLNRSREKIAEVFFLRAGQKVDVRAPKAVIDNNINTAVTIVLAAYPTRQSPVEVVVQLKEPTLVQGIYYAPVQNDRMFEGCIKEYGIECLTESGWRSVLTGVFENSLFAQKVMFSERALGRQEKISALKCKVFSCYGQGEKTVWIEEKDGWHRVRKKAAPKVCLASFHLICEGDGVHDNIRFWRKDSASATKEIEA